MDAQPTREERLFEIPDTNWHLFEERFAKILKRVAKLKCGEVGYEIVKEEIKQAPAIIIKGDYENGGVDEIKEDKRMIKWRTIRVWGDEPKLAGWTFIAKLEHDEKIGTCVKTLPGYELPELFRQADRFNCDHCHKHLWRRDTFVMRNEAGDYKQVGRQCLRDFLGHENPEHAAAYAEYYLTIFSMADDAREYDFGGGGHYAEEYFDLGMILSHTVASIEAYGWMSRGKAETGLGRPTSDRVSSYLSPNGDHDVKLNASAEDQEEAASIIEWALALPQAEVDKDDYLYNIHIMAKAGVATWRRLGFACSMVASYRYRMGKLSERKAKMLEADKSEYFGEVGKRLLIGEVILVGAYGPWESQFGTSRLYKFKKDNFVFTWLTGSVLNHETKRTVGEGALEGQITDYKKVEIGEAVMIKVAKVKEHKEWHGWKETAILRPTFEGLKHATVLDTKESNPI